MNPGSSKPKNGIENGDKETEAVPDNTQDQIMRIMLNCGFNYARILNLSDLRQPKSKLFYDELITLKQHKIFHSIFDNKRKNEFENLFIENIPIILAWGVNSKLKVLTEIAMKKLMSKKLIGIKKEGHENAYYHPLPQNNNKQKEWVFEMTKKIKDFKILN